MGFYLRRVEDKDFDSEEWTYAYNGKTIFSTKKYPRLDVPVREVIYDGKTGKEYTLKRPFASVWWPPEEADAKSFMDKFLSFYRGIDLSGKYRATKHNDKVYKGLFLVGADGRITEERSVSPFEEVSSVLEDVLESGEFSLIIIGTPYADFSLEALSAVNSGDDLSINVGAKVPCWKDDERRLGIATRINLSEPLSDLIARTGRIAILKEDLQPVLRDLLTF